MPPSRACCDTYHWHTPPPLSLTVWPALHTRCRGTGQRTLCILSHRQSSCSRWRLALHGKLCVVDTSRTETFTEFSKIQLHTLLLCKNHITSMHLPLSMNDRMAKNYLQMACINRNERTQHRTWVLYLWQLLWYHSQWHLSFIRWNKTWYLERGYLLTYHTDTLCPACQLPLVSMATHRHCNHWAYHCIQFPLSYVLDSQYMHLPRESEGVEREVWERAVRRELRRRW